MLAGRLAALGAYQFLINPGAAQPWSTTRPRVDPLLTAVCKDANASIKKVWKPASLLATVGVLVTAAGHRIVAAAYVLDRPLWKGCFTGRLVGSTDAAAVFLRCCVTLAFIYGQTLEKAHWK